MSSAAVTNDPIKRGHLPPPKIAVANVHRNVRLPQPAKPISARRADGKEPALASYSEAIATALRKACGAAYRAMGKPPGGMSMKDAA